MSDHAKRDDTAEYGSGDAIADLSVKHGVKHLIYSGVDLAGMEDTGIPHYVEHTRLFSFSMLRLRSFEVKRANENHIHSLPSSI